MYEFLKWCVEDVMSKPICVTPDVTLVQVERLLEHHGFDALPVIDLEGRLQGVVSSLDLLRAFDVSEDDVLPDHASAMQRPVDTVMSRDAHSVTPRMPLSRALRKLLDSRCKSFPVVDRGRVVGVVAREDVMQALRRAQAGELPGLPRAC